MWSPPREGCSIERAPGTRAAPPLTVAPNDDSVARLAAPRSGQMVVAATKGSERSVAQEGAHHLSRKKRRTARRRRKNDRDTGMRPGVRSWRRRSGTWAAACARDLVRAAAVGDATNKRRAAGGFAMAWSGASPLRADLVHARSGGDPGDTTPEDVIESCVCLDVMWWGDQSCRSGN